MMVGQLRATAWLAFIILSIGIGTNVTRARQADDFSKLSRQVGKLYRDRKYAEATDIARRALAMAERQFGPGDVSTALNYLGMLYHAQGRYAEAEPLQKRALIAADVELIPVTVIAARLSSSTK
jgi:tetratricopeptide (TPR) repeat protein